MSVILLMSKRLFLYAGPFDRFPLSWQKKSNSAVTPEVQGWPICEMSLTVLGIVLLPATMLKQTCLLLACLAACLPASLGLRLLPDMEEQCSQPLGLQDGSIRDSQLTASSSYQPSLVGPSKARLHSELGGGAWCPRSPVSGLTETPEWIQVDLGAEHIITGLITQGRFAHGLGQEFAEHFMVQVWREGMQVWEDYRDDQGGRLLPGNTNTFSPAEIPLTEGPLIASKIRILPFSHHPRTVCVRLELLGCLYTGSFFSVLTANSPSANDSASLQRALQVDDWNEATFLGAAVGILVTVSLAAAAAVVLVLVRNRVHRKSLATFSRYSGSQTDSRGSIRPGGSCQGSLPSQASFIDTRTRTRIRSTPSLPPDPPPLVSPSPPSPRSLSPPTHSPLPSPPVVPSSTMATPQRDLSAQRAALQATLAARTLH